MGKGRLYLTQRCHHHTDCCVKMGSVVIKPFQFFVNSDGTVTIKTASINHSFMIVNVITDRFYTELYYSPLSSRLTTLHAVLVRVGLF